jgi:hypothetical protein
LENGWRRILSCRRRFTLCSYFNFLPIFYLNQGTSQEQDTRFVDKQKKMLKTMKFPKEYNIKVDMKKVKLDVIKPWITKKISDLLGFEDEVLIGFIFGLLEQEKIVIFLLVLSSSLGSTAFSRSQIIASEYHCIFVDGCLWVLFRIMETSDKRTE